MEELRERIDEAFQTITPEMRGNAVNNYIKRLKKCVKNGGAHIEVTLDGHENQNENEVDDESDPEISDEEADEDDEEEDEEEQEDVDDEDGD